MSAGRLEGKQVVFIGGLHRSGTTPVARWLAQHPDVSGFEDTGVWEDEGQHLQSVYPVAQAHGGPGRFAFAAGARLDEHSPLATPDARERLVEAWAPHWDLSRRVLVEKSPPNLVRMRFLQHLFDDAVFVMVTRHPIAVSYATQKWSRTPLDSLLRHWLVAHEQFVADAAHVPSVVLVRYEDVMAAPARIMGALFERLGLEPHEGNWTVKPGLNEAYLARWRADGSPLKRARAVALAIRHERRVRAFGYSLRDPDRLLDAAPEVARYLLASR